MLMKLTQGYIYGSNDPKRTEMLIIKNNDSKEPLANCTEHMCHICGKIFKEKKKLKRHVEKVHLQVNLR